MDFNVTREQWIDRFVIRFSQLEAGAEPLDFLALATDLWPARGHLGPEAAAEAEVASRLANVAAAGNSPDFQNTHRDAGDMVDLAGPAESPFERTMRIPVERVDAEGEYVRDTGEWIARCVARVLQLDPIIKTEEAQRSVADLASLERWRLMKPEAAANQLYTPIKPRPA